jgi:hypothetical protein
MKHFVLFIMVLLVPTLGSTQQQNAAKEREEKNCRLIPGTNLKMKLIPGVTPGTLNMPVVTSFPITAKVLDDVPAYDWSFGCSPTCAAMLAGYYDRGWYPDIYTGPTNSGVAPLDNSIWGTVVINGETRSQCPISATRNGVDGRLTRGHVDDYWIKKDNIDPDPYITNGWIQHSYGDCTGDFMFSSQSAFGNKDGRTPFIYPDDGGPYSGDDSTHDGLYGLKQFFLSRGYNVSSYYNQEIEGYNGLTVGYTFGEFREEIDAGRPVLIHITDHTMLGVGYDDADSTVYVHDTDDYSVHEMTWGGNYAGRQHESVSVIHLVLPVLTDQVTDITYTTAQCGGTVNTGEGIAVTARGICWNNVPQPTLSDNHTVDGWGQGVFTSVISGLDTGTTYFVRSYATSSLGTVYGNEVVFTTSSHYIGQEYGGGVIFYLNEEGTGGLIAAPTDQASGAQWGCNGTLVGTSTAVGTGQTNTTSIANGCSQAGIAARICDELVLNGYDDWYLPSKDELNLMYLHKPVIPNLGTCSYWSSSEGGSTYVWVHNLFYGFQGYDGKTATWNYLRAIRSFSEFSAPATRAVRDVHLIGGQPACYDASQVIVTAGGGTVFKVYNGGNATLVAGEKISMLPGTRVYSGGNLWAHILPEGPFCPATPATLPSAQAVGLSGILPAGQESDPAITVYPNPAAGTFQFHINGSDGQDKISAIVYNSLGHNVFSGIFNGTGPHAISLAGVPQGLYIVKVFSKTRIFTTRLIHH